MPSLGVGRTPYSRSAFAFASATLPALLGGGREAAHLHDFAASKAPRRKTQQLVKTGSHNERALDRHRAQGEDDHEGYGDGPPGLYRFSHGEDVAGRGP